MLIYRFGNTDVSLRRNRLPYGNRLTLFPVLQKTKKIESILLAKPAVSFYLAQSKPIAQVNGSVPRPYRLQTGLRFQGRVGVSADTPTPTPTVIYSTVSAHEPPTGATANLQSSGTRSHGL